MLEITYGYNCDTEQELTISSDKIIAVVWPCSHFEAMTLWRELQEVWKIPGHQITTPSMTRSYLVDWVHFLGEQKDIQVKLEVWWVLEQPIVLVDSFGDMFSYNMVEDWLKIG